MRDAIRETGVHRLAAEMEIGLAGMADRPFADAVVQIEQCRLARDLRARRHCRSEEHTSELQSLMRISYAVFCLKKKRKQQNKIKIHEVKTKHKREEVRKE